MIFAIGEKLTETTWEEYLNDQTPYVAVLSARQWEEKKDQFSLGIDMEIRFEIDATKAEVNYDSLTGNFSVPNRNDLCDEHIQFAFALDEKGIVFIDDTGYVLSNIESMTANKKWRLPSLERFIFDFLEQMVSGDLKMLESYEDRLEKLEDAILEGNFENILETQNDIRSDLLELRTHYEQLIDLGQELEENENNFFDPQNLRYFKLITRRIERYRDQVAALRDYSAQIRDLYQTQMDVRQNKKMTILTIITTIFFPLSIITGWYGMNFANMPELEYQYAYPILGGICLLVVLTGVTIFKIKKWI